VKKLKYMGLFVFIFSIILMCSGCVRDGREHIEDIVIDSVEEKQYLGEIAFRIPWSAYSGRGVAIQKIVDVYNLENDTDYKISVVGGDENLSLIQADLFDEEKTLIYLLPYRYVQYLGDLGLLEDLTYSMEPYEDYFYKELWSLATIEDKVFGVPWLGHAMGLIYNKDLLKQAEVDPASIVDLETLLKALENIESKTEAMGIGLVGADHNDISWMVNQFIYGFGGQLVDEEGTKVLVNSEAGKAALNFYKHDLGKYAQETWTDDNGEDVMAYFREGKVAFEIQGPWGITDIWKNQEPFDTGVIPLVDIGIYPEVGPMMISIDQNMQEDKKLAIRPFVEFLISHEGQRMIMNGEYSPEHDRYYPFRLPVRRDMIEQGEMDDYPEFYGFVSGFDHPSVDVPVPKWQIIKDHYYESGLHNVMKGNMTIEAFLAWVENEGNIILMDEK
jgi:ABC-type glycerol-3-phosphate transport system substrate-binding protein